MTFYILQVRNAETDHLGPKYGWYFDGIFQDETQAAAHYEKYFSSYQYYPGRYTIHPAELRSSQTGKEFYFVAITNPDYFYYPMLFRTMDRYDRSGQFY